MLTSFPTISFFRSFRLIFFVFFSLLIFISCGENTTASEVYNPILTGDGNTVTFTADDNSILDDDISFTVNTNQTVYYFFVPKTAPSDRRLFLTGSGSLNEVAGRKNYAAGQKFIYEGTTYTIYGVRKPTVTDGPITDIVSLDYNIEADKMNGAVFGLYASTVTGITADNVRNLSVKMTRNTVSGTTEHLLAAMAGSTPVGTSGGIGFGGDATATDTSADDRKLLVPNTSYTLYMVYDFVNATNHLINLGTRKTAKGTEAGIGGGFDPSSFKDLINPSRRTGDGTTLTIPATGENSVILLNLFHDQTNDYTPFTISKTNLDNGYTTIDNKILYESTDVPKIKNSLYYANYTNILPGYHAFFMIRVASDVDFFAAGNDIFYILSKMFKLHPIFHKVKRD